MIQAQKAPDIGLKVGDPEYWDLLGRSLHLAKELLWKRLQHGLYADDEVAKATMEAYWAIKKVVRLLEEKMRQISLPILPVDKDPLVMVKPLPPPREVDEQLMNTLTEAYRPSRKESEKEAKTPPPSEVAEKVAALGYPSPEED